MLNHLIVSLLWMTWHLPYYFYYLDRQTLNSAITVSLPVFLLMGYLVMFPTAVFLSVLTLEAGYVNNQSIAAWLTSAIERIERKDYSIHIGNS